MHASVGDEIIIHGRVLGTPSRRGEVLEAHGAGRPPVVHRVPSTGDFREAVRRGLGWGLLPEAHLVPDLAQGRVVRLPGTRAADVPLFWQRWRLDSEALADLSTDVRRAAAALRGRRRLTGGTGATSA